MGFSGLDRYSYEHHNFEREEKILGYIALKGCAWSTDISRNLLMDSEEVNKLLAKMIVEKQIIVVVPFDRFRPPAIVMTRAAEIFNENANSLTPENWAKRSFFYLSFEGLDNWIAGNRSKGLKAHVIYLEMYNIILDPIEQQTQGQS